MEDNASLTFEGWGYRHASRKHFAVRDLTLEIKPGQRVLLLGASGIGKSTILEGAAGLLGSDDANDGASGAGTGSEDSDGGVTEGRILVDGVPVRKARGRVGLVLQDPDAQAVFQRLGDNVAFGPENLNVPREEIWRRVRESLDAVGMEGVQLHRSTMHVSGGQQQRIALAGALAMRPGVLLLDEPTANLDPDGVDQIVDAVGQVLASHHSTMVLVEHRAGPWIDLIDRVVVLGLQSSEQTAARVNGTGREGDIDRSGFRRTVVVADGTPDEIFRDPSIDFAALGIWVPERYRRPEDEIRRIHTPGEPDTDPALGTGETLLSCRDLAIGRGGKAIAEHINLDFSAGQITALVGANGAGKSTLSLTLAGLLEPVAGAVEASPALAAGAQGGSPFAWKSTELASRISYVFQNPEHQFAKGSVLEEVMVAPLRCGMSQEKAESRARELLKRFSLSQYANANPYTLSGGEKRRLTVASALAAAPRVLLLDEPTFGQDRRTWMQIVTLINTLRADGVSIIVVTHDRELVTALGARLVELVPERARGEWQGGGDAVRVSEVNARTEPPKASSRSPLLASLNPVHRLIGAFVISIPLLFSLDWVSATVAVAIEAVLLMGIGFTPWRIVRSTWPIWVGAPTSALAVLLYGKSGGDTWWQWGLMHITDRSAELAVATAVRIVAIGVPAIITVLGIDATDLADAFSQILHLPDRFVYGGLAGLRLFSVLQDDWAALTASRRSRGLGDENKFKAFGPQAFALLVLSVRRSTTLATAMEARGFGGTGPRSHARVSEVHARDKAFIALCLGIPTVALIAAGFAGTFSFMGGA
ncbi:ATP-binding cassette domain-containing protein [Bifidobacterium vespertilionis]|uniref:ATP-binding cassette domain-containing protein n=1 Tax=Bifidobacterium vespertilionis TaxID=2562524 RepID=UPI001BDC4471|nr:ATP-binding cassette domain-containing protein [Bifidobacterium vespertilionis]MBT1178689.1 ATP-binding cassette domain-containing protein [Bifidobacterium vespertilionis]